MDSDLYTVHFIQYHIYLLLKVHFCFLDAISETFPLLFSPRISNSESEFEINHVVSTNIQLLRPLCLRCT